MRLLLSIALVVSMGIFIACETEVSSTTIADDGVKNNHTERADKTSDGNGADDGHDHDDDVKRISLEDAKKAFDDGNAIFVDTRSKNAYVNEHIKGAKNIPLADFGARYKELPRDKKIIVYCS